MEDFIGVKIALFTQDKKLLVYLRDDKPGLRFANMWDFPGGGREGEESPFDCAKREVREEFGIQLTKNSIIYTKRVSAMHDESVGAYFMVGHITQQDIDKISFGSEGQRWKLMSIDDFMSSDQVVEQLKGRLEGYLSSVT